jgi:PadR family transcriptional regulator, regulatory protein PadR
MPERSDRQDLFPGALEMMILQTLRLGPLHGYALAQAIKRASDDMVHVEEGSLYPALQRMLKSKWLTAEWGTSERNREVRVYRLTREGRKQLEAKVNKFDRLLAGILKVMKANET